MTHDEVTLAAWQEALDERLLQLGAAVGVRDWTRARDLAQQVFEGLRRADPVLLLRRAREIQQAGAILIRAAMEREPPARRVAVVEAAFLDVLDFAPELRLRDCLALVPAPPPDLDGFLRAWARALGNWAGRWRDHEVARARLQREALVMDLGADGLAALARQSDELEVWMAWIDALEAEDRPSEAMKAAAAGARSLYWPRHRLLLRLREGRAAARLDLLPQANRAWREVWRHHLCTAGLCMVWDAAGPNAPGFFREELEQAYTGDKPLAVDLQVRIELLLGDADLPLARLQSAARGGWWSEREHPATQVLPFLLRVGTHQAQLDEGLLCSMVWRATDEDGRWRPRPPEPVPPGWSSLVDGVIRAHPTWLTDAVAWRVTAANELVELAGAVIEAKARDAYLKVAALVVALVEAGTAAEDPEAEAPLDAIRRRFVRNKALLAEIDRLRLHSPLLRGARGRSAGPPGPG